MCFGRSPLPLIPNDKVRTMDENEIFMSFAGSFITTADSIDTMMLLSGIAITAWNLSFSPEEEIDERIDTFQKKMKKTDYTNHGSKTLIRDAVIRMMREKQERFADHIFLVHKAQFESNEDGSLNIRVATSQTTPKPPQYNA
jgi:hypothetical protein